MYSRTAEINYLQVQAHQVEIVISESFYAVRCHENILYNIYKLHNNKYNNLRSQKI